MPTKLAGTKYTLSDDFRVDRSVVSVATTVNVRAFGAGPEKTAAENTAAIAAAIAQAVLRAPTTVVFPSGGGTYQCSGTFGTFAASDLTIDLGGSTLDFSSATSATAQTFIDFLGTYDATAVLTGNVAKAAVTIPCVSTAFAVGDMVRLYSSEVYDPARTSSKFGEIGYIASIPDSASVTLADPIDFAYTTANAATIQKLTPCRNVHVRNGKIVGTAANNEHMGIRMRVAADCSISGIRSYNMDRMHVQITDGSRCQVVGNWFNRSNHASLGYGTSFADAAQDIICSGNHYFGVRHSLSTNNNSTSFGVPRRIMFSLNTVEAAARATGGAGGDAIDTHACAEQIYIINNMVTGATGSGINFEARTGVIEGNTIYGCQKYGINANPRAAASPEITIRGNSIRQVGLEGNSGFGIGIVYGLNTASALNTTVTENYVESTEQAISVTGSSSYSHTRAVVAGNTCVGASGTLPGIGLSYLRQASVAGNVAVGGLYAIRLSHCLRTSVSGNSVENIGANASAFGIRIDGTSSYNIVTGNTALDSTSSGTTTGVMLFDTGVTYTSVQSNVLSGYNTAVTTGAGTGNVAANNV